jgi:hypothetical protein
VRPIDGWNNIGFQVAPSTVQPIVLQGLGAETRFQFAGAARPERTGQEFLSYLPPDGCVNLSWKEVRPEVEGKLFYAAEMLSQISVSPGLLLQTAVLDFKIMQGELSQVVLMLRGAGEVTRVQGDQVLGWKLEPVANSPDRRLLVQLNQPQKEQFRLQVQLQRALEAFPQTVDAMVLRPEDAIRFVGYCRVVNEGAVRLEIAEAARMSQISPEQFPESDSTKSILRPAGSQRFAYRFSGGDFALRIRADQILPEISVAQLLTYHLGENETSVDAELELDIREAPVRELVLRVPKAYAVARLNVPGLSDYFLQEPADQPNASLRIVYSQPVTGRQVLQARLESSTALGATNWSLPRIEVAQAKSARGQIGVSADAGFRLTPERTQGLTEIATAFFPRKVPGLQMAFRMSEPAWEAAVRIERLPQSLQADVLHLFSVSEGTAYGSSVINYVISSAPVSAFRLDLSSEYFNVEFTGKDIRNWQKTTNGYVVQLHGPVSGPYTLLATYERPFRPQGETLGFTGARPLDAQPEQGHVLVVSGYEFQVVPAEVSPGLLPLEAGEVPPEYRLFFDTPVLAAYRYTSRPFNLRLALSPVARGESLSQVVDRATLHTRISKAGQVLTDVRYFLKNRGYPHFRLAVPAGTILWSANVNGVAAVPVTDGNANLIPLPQGIDPNAIITLDLQLAAPTNRPGAIRVAAPIVATPVLLAQWKVEADTGQRLVSRGGALTPVEGQTDISGFGGLTRTFTGPRAEEALILLGAVLALLALAVMVWRWTVSPGVHRFTLRWFSGASLGLLSLVLATAAFVGLADILERETIQMARDLTFLAPVQQANSALYVEVATKQAATSAWDALGYAWPALFGLILWLYGMVARPGWFRSGGWLLVWLLFAWAALRWPNGAPAFLLVLAAFLIVHVVAPALIRLARVPAQSRPLPPPISSGAAAAPVAIVLLLCSLWFGAGYSSAAVEAADGAAKPATTLQNGPENAEMDPVILPDPSRPPTAESVLQQGRVADQFLFATTTIHWRATKGQILPLLSEPGVLTGVLFPTNVFKLVTASTGGRRVQQLLALESNDVEIKAEYQVPIVKREGESGFVLPTSYGLVNRMELTLNNLDVDVSSSSAVSVQRELAGSNTVARLVLAPDKEAWIGWKPRSRDLKREKPVFYAELSQLYVPSPGVVEGAHHVALRPAQGELAELVFNVPSGATITDVLDPADAGTLGTTNRQAQPGPSLVSLWRFDPDTRKLRVTLHPAQSRPFALLIRSQVATGPFPYQQSLGLMSVEGAAGQIGLLGLATGSEVQLDSVTAGGFAPLNLEDFGRAALGPLQAQDPALTLRRAYRYTDSNAQAQLSASAVQPDVRVETQDTLSLGEDRILLAANLSVSIARAGIFQLNFRLPAGLEVESISGEALSHWTESRTDTERIVSLHLRGKTEGQKQFAITLAGPGVRQARSWVVPQLLVREAAKQRGTLLIVPEQGMRLEVASREGVAQFDPQKSGVQQKGVLAFRALQVPWNLRLDVEQVDAWIQVTSLQHATVHEALLKVAGNLQYQIENTGLKAFRVWVPSEADSVRFQGEQIADFRALTGVVTNGLQSWEVKLHRRVIGPYALRLQYQAAIPEGATQLVVRGFQPADVNLQRGFLTVQSAGRLQLRAETAPPSLQPTEWQAIPRPLQLDPQTTSAHLAYRLIEPSFQLPLTLERHAPARLLPARVNKVALTSVVSDNGVVLTQVRLDLSPGDKRLLHLTLPQDARFWFAFVNQTGVWPWREQDRILIPLDPSSHSAKSASLEIFYSTTTPQATTRRIDLELVAPGFDLPLEDVTWRVFLNDKWQLKDWTGSLQLAEKTTAPAASAADVQIYLQNEASAQREKTKVAEQMLAFGNSALAQGDPQQARRAFQAAYGLSQGDDAFNEDARVQLNNLKVQQALVGLNVRQAAIGGEADSVANRLRDLRGAKDMNYTQQDAKAILDRNTADENAAFLRLAQRLIQQQEAASTTPTAIRASIPEQGQLFTFKRAVVADTWADLRVGLEAKAPRAASWTAHLLVLAGILLVLGLFAWGARAFRTQAAA